MRRSGTWYHSPRLRCGREILAGAPSGGTVAARAGPKPAKTAQESPGTASEGPKAAQKSPNGFQEGPEMQYSLIFARLLVKFQYVVPKPSHQQGSKTLASDLAPSQQEPALSVPMPGR